MCSISVLLADDHALVRAGISALLGEISGVKVVGEASDGHEALAMIQAQRPDVALLDIGMAKLNGLLVTQRVRQAYPRTHVLILSMHTNPAYIIQALINGATGYLLKDAATAELEDAVRATARGERYLSCGLPKAEIDATLKQSAAAGSHRSTPRPLPPRQAEVLQLIAEGHTTKGIAALMQVSFKTAETHRTKLMQRLDIHDVAGLVRFAVDHGVVQSSTMTDMAEIRV